MNGQTSVNELKDNEYWSHDAYLAMKYRMKVKSNKILLDTIFSKILNKEILSMDDALVKKFFKDINYFLVQQIQFFRIKVKSLVDDDNNATQTRFQDPLQKSEQFNNLRDILDDVLPDQNSYDNFISQNDFQTKKLYKPKNYSHISYKMEEFEERYQYKENFVKINQKQYQCKLCHQIFGQIALCQKHYSKTHAQQSYRCQVCQLIFGCMTDLFTHDFVLHNPNFNVRDKKEIKCAFCQTEYTSQRGYRQHLLRKHTEDFSPLIEQFKQTHQDIFTENT